MQEASTDASASSDGGAEEAAPEPEALADGDYEIEVDTDSSMFRSHSCILHVSGDELTATLSLPGEGFSRLYFGTSEEAETADEDDIYDYYLNDEGKYTFDIPVSALDEDLTITAYGQRRERWYDHTINFMSPAASAAKAA